MLLMLLKSVQNILMKWNELIERKFQILETEVNLGDFCHKDMSARQFFRQQVGESK